MIILNKEMSYVNWYLSQKEYFLQDNVRKALNKIYNFINKKKLPKAVSIHIVNELFKKNENVDLGKRFLHEKYNSRLAHIHNAKVEFKKWELDFRLRHYGMKKKLCECGCGQEVKKDSHRFIHGHNIRMRSKKEKEYYAQVMLDKRPKKIEGEKIIQVDFKSLHKST